MKAELKSFFILKPSAFILFIFLVHLLVLAFQPGLIQSEQYFYFPGFRLRVDPHVLPPGSDLLVGQG